MLGVWSQLKLQALVYDILPSTRKVPESDARSVVTDQILSTGLRHPSFNEEGAGKRCSECGDSYDSDDRLCTLTASASAV